ncbi:hypothetical protein BDF14DRAFT_1731014, partial [Spinellus fusiger]
WREQGEKSPGYLKATIQIRQIQRTVPPLRHPTTNALCDTSPTMTEAAQAFYTTLLTPEKTEEDSVSTLLRQIPENRKIIAQQQEDLLVPLTIEDRQ